jgi:hypothetical protein
MGCEPCDMCGKGDAPRSLTNLEKNAETEDIETLGSEGGSVNVVEWGGSPVDQLCKRVKGTDGLVCQVWVMGDITQACRQMYGRLHFLARPFSVRALDTPTSLLRKHSACGPAVRA